MRMGTDTVALPMRTVDMAHHIHCTAASELRALERADRNLRRAYERADRAARRQQEREARAYNKLMRAQDRYYSRYGYPYEFGYELGPAPYRYNRGG